MAKNKIKSLRESYSTLLAAFKAAGVNLTEAQKADIDQFVLAIESKIEDTKQLAVKATKTVVERNCEAEFRKVMESIIKHQAEHAEIASKIQQKVTALNESKKVAAKVDEYLNTYLESVMPEQQIVDYDRMNKLESIVESLRDTLIVNDETVESKVAENKAEFDKQAVALNEKIESLSKDLNESMKRELNLKKQIDSAKAIKFIESKTSDLPLFEARQIKKRLANASYEDAKKDFKKVLEAVQSEMEEACATEEQSLEEEIGEILREESKDKPCKECGKTPKAPTAPATDADGAETESTELYKTSEDDTDPLTESEKINSDMMLGWMNAFSNIKSSQF